MTPKATDTDSINKLLEDLENHESTDVSSGLDIFRLLHSTRKSLLIGILALICTTSASYLYVKYTKPRYQSHSILKLDVQSQAGDLGFKTGTEFYTDNLAGELALLKSKYIHQKVIDSLHLQISYHLQGSLINEERYKNAPFDVVIQDSTLSSLPDVEFDLDIIDENTFELFSSRSGERQSIGEHQFGTSINAEGLLMTINKTISYSNVYDGRSFVFKLHSYTALYSYILSNLQVNILNPQARTIQVTFEDETPKKAYDIVQAIDQYYLTTTLQKKNLANKKMVDFIDDQIDSTQTQLNEAERNLENYFKRMKTNDPNGEFSRISQKLNDLEEKLIQQKFTENLLKEVKILIEENRYEENYYPISQNGLNEQLEHLLATLNIAVKDFEEIKSANKPTTLAYKAKESEVKRLTSSVENIIKTELEAIGQNINKTQRNIEDLESLFDDLPSKETELNRLKRYYELYEKFYLALKDKRVSYGISMAGTVPEFVVLAAPFIPSTPVSPQKNLIYSIGIGGGFLVFALIILINFLIDNTILSLKDLEQHIQAPIVGTIPKYTADEMDVSRLIVDKNPKSIISESLRAIRTNLEFVKQSKSNLLLSVTSTVSGEGKTFVAINLGGILALNKKVILMDMDMRKPKIHRAFDETNEVGMSTLLIGKSNLDESIRKTPMENFDYIAAGPTPPNPSELMMRQDFLNLIESLKERYDIIMIDTPPIGLVTDAMMAMKLVDIPLFVVRMRYSKKGVEKIINKYSNRLGIRNLSIILNSVEIGKRGYGDGYGYEYGYGQGYYDEQEVKKTKKFFFF